VCGIAGIVDKANDVVDAADVHRMCQTMIHRGPDDEGTFAQGPVALGIRRLSVIDVVGGHQPIHNEDESVWVVLNGEIYNFLELRRDLESRGHRFYTHSDTEVIVHLYEEMGTDCVKKLRGMFAIALYDRTRRRLLLARDRLGKKPLHYAWSRGRLLFASEMKAILAVAPELAEVNPEGLLQYFYFGYIPDPLTAFHQIHKLPPGHLLEYDGDRCAIRQYWDVPAYGTQVGMSEEDCLRELERRLDEAVQMRLISDVPLGALLSGGVDSSIVVALMARASRRRVKTFSIGFSADEFDESRHARRVAEQFGSEHQELLVKPDIEETLQFLTGMLEEPFGDSSMLPTYYLCRMARQQVTVALSGDGGDELFAGYDRYQVAMNHRYFDHLPDWMGDFYRRRLHHHLPTGAYGRNRAWNLSLSARERYLDDISLLPVLHREKDLFTEEFLESSARLPDPLGQFLRLYDDAPASDALSRLLFLDTKTYLAGDILTKVDRMSMAVSLEVRSPLLDHQLVEWVAGLPITWKSRNGTRKYLLKKLAERLRVPATALHRPKQGFALPLALWMKKELKEQFLSVLLEPQTLQRGYFKPEAVRTLLSEHQHGRRDRSGVLWRMLVLELWHRNFLHAATTALPR
jgi:asparagine synthase (glutamine-hydrolysing)